MRVEHRAIRNRTHRNVRAHFNSINEIKGQKAGFLSAESSSDHHMSCAEATFSDIVKCYICKPNLVFLHSLLLKEGDDVVHEGHLGVEREGI